MGLFSKRLPVVVPGDGDKSPFFARGDARGVLCLHGFSGSPFEVRPIAEGLAARGYTVRAPMLAGHGGDAEALAATRWTDWLASAARAFNQLKDDVGGGPVAIAGFSTGGLLGLHICHDRPDDVVALMAAVVPLQLKPGAARAARVVNAVPWALRHGRLRHLPKHRYDVTDEQMRAKNPGMTHVPTAGVGQLLDLGDTVRPLLPAIKTPTLVVHGLLDSTVPQSASLELLAALGSPIVQRLWLANSAHLVGLDVERGTLLDATDVHFGRAFSSRNERAAQ